MVFVPTSWGREVILVGQPVTTNPLVIMLINMTIVFGVLVGLQLMVEAIHMIDPTKKKKEEPKAAPAPAAAPAAAAPAAAAPAADNNAVIAVIAAAVASYGYSSAQIIAVRPMEAASWKNSGRLSGVNNTVM